MFGGRKSHRCWGTRGNPFAQRGFIGLGIRRGTIGRGGNNNPTLDLQFGSDAAVDPRIVYTGGAGGTYLDNTGTVRPQRGNLWTQSEFVNGLTDAGVRSGLLSSTTFSGYAGAIAFGRDGVTDSYAYKNTVTTVIGQTYTLSVVVMMTDTLIPVFGNLGTPSAVANDFVFVIGNVQCQGTPTITSLGNGVYRVSSTFTAIQASVNNGILKMSSNSARTFKVTAYQFEPGSIVTPYIPTTTAAVFAPRIDASTVSRTNLLTWSQDPTNLAWGKGATGTAQMPVVTGNYAAAPDGSLTACRVQLTKGAGTTLSDFAQINPTIGATLVNGTSYTYSFWIKATSSGQVGKIVGFRGAAGTAQTLVILTSDWQRVQSTEVGNSVVTQCGIMLRGTTSTSDDADFLLWGAQLELGFIPTDYIWTTWAAGTVAPVRTNILKNTVFAGAVSGSGGAQTYPSTWRDAQGLTAGSVFTVNANGSLSFSGGVGDRALMGQTVTLLAGQKMTVSFDVLAASGGTDSISQVVTISGAITSDSPASNVLGNVAPGHYRMSFLAGSAGWQGTVRFGVGCGSNLLAPGSVTIANVQAEYDYVATPYIANAGTTTNASAADIRGVLMEEQRTNALRNNTMVGAASGTPGTVPTNWSLGLNGITGLTTTLTVGSEGGMTTLDLRVNGTPSASSLSGIQFFMETATGVAATAAQVWSYSSFLSIVAGSLTNVGQPQFNLQTYTSAPVFIQNNTANITIGSGTLAANRIVSIITIAGASTASIRPVLQFGVTINQPIDFTVRIGLPQVELGSFATSAIPTTSAAVTRTIDAALLSDVSWLTQGKGTLYVEFDVLDVALAQSRIAADLSDGATSNRIQIGNSATQSSNGFVATGAATQVQLNLGTAQINTRSKEAMSYQDNNTSLSANGVLSSIDSACTIPTGVTSLRIGNVSGAATNILNGHVGRVKYWSNPLPPVQLPYLTAP